VNVAGRPATRAERVTQPRRGLEHAAVAEAMRAVDEIDVFAEQRLAVGLARRAEARRRRVVLLREVAGLAEGRPIGAAQAHPRVLQHGAAHQQASATMGVGPESTAAALRKVSPSRSRKASVRPRGAAPGSPPHGCYPRFVENLEARG
jgi:hypothetical protein